MELSNVFISSTSFRLPRVSTSDDLYAVVNSNNVDELSIIRKEFVVNNQNNKKSRVSLLELHSKSRDIEFMPRKSDAKVMRPDVIASAICAQELVCNIDKKFLPEKDISFYMSNGFCLDRLSDTINEMSSKYIKPELESEVTDKEFIVKQNQSLDRFTPPLFVLNALTNAAQSFASQYGEFKGDNATQGGTSQSSYYCLNEACQDLTNLSSKLSVVGSSNGAGIYSGSSNQTRIDDDLFECEASSFILLETIESLNSRSAKPIAKITSIHDSKVIPSLFRKRKLGISEKFLIENKKSSNCIFSGAYSSEDHEVLRDKLSTIWNMTHSTFSIWGNSGVSQNFLDITLGIEVMRKNNLKNIDCYNRDIFGRESLVSLELCYE
jgi:hypothetical protein